MTSSELKWDRREEEKKQKEAALLIMVSFGRELSNSEKYEHEFVSCLQDVFAFVRRNRNQRDCESTLKKIVRALNLYNSNHFVLRNIKRWSQYDISEEQA